VNEVNARGHLAASTLCSSFHTLRRTGGQKNEQMEAFIPFLQPGADNASRDFSRKTPQRYTFFDALYI
jgi:hypothetical protein